uniref:Uncharacterized protein n=1 Tax=Attheya septentrionalis TaxID=420275 RepID=A0A7S2XNW7_9STRA|mmetsp:Transcript_25328/g.45875  ORF Transcript_25328/g.45875 Transcript_25328/m.45875 type:complete len:376 (+) Transcript_25328:40-1167(+)
MKVAVKVEDPRVMAAILSAAIANGAVRRYGSLQSDISPVPLNVKKKQDRLQKLADVPSDNRAEEVASAVSVSGLLGVCFLWNAVESLFGTNHPNDFGSDDYSWITTLVSSTSVSSIVITTVVTVFVLDNFFDVLRTGSQFLLESKAMPDSVRDRNWVLPSKDAMPLGLGSGKITGTVVAGLGRLVNVDTERECECEAAALFCAYSLGLPCFAFRPNALEAAVLMVESVQPPSAQDGKFGSALDPLWSSMGLLKVLIWLMAPVAMESSKHAQLQASDPREGSGFLQRLEQKSQLLLDASGSSSNSSSNNNNDNVISDLLRSDNPESQQEAQDLIKWAYAEADLMLRNNKPTITALTERLIGGAATVGDCIAVIEEW